MNTQLHSALVSQPSLDPSQETGSADAFGVSVLVLIGRPLPPFTKDLMNAALACLKLLFW